MIEAAKTDLGDKDGVLHIMSLSVSDVLRLVCLLQLLRDVFNINPDYLLNWGWSVRVSRFKLLWTWKVRLGVGSFTTRFLKYWIQLPILNLYSFFFLKFSLHMSCKNFIPNINLPQWMKKLVHH